MSHKWTKDMQQLCCKIQGHVTKCNVHTVIASRSSEKAIDTGVVIDKNISNYSIFQCYKWRTKIHMLTLVSCTNSPKYKLFLKMMRLHPVLRAVASEPLDTASCGQRPMDGIFSWNNSRIVDPEFRWYENSSSIEGCKRSICILHSNAVSDPRLSFHGDIALEVLQCQF